MPYGTPPTNTTATITTITTPLSNPPVTAAAAAVDPGVLVLVLVVATFPNRAELHPRTFAPVP